MAAMAFMSNVSRIRPAEENANLVYHSTSAANDPIFRYLNRTVYDGGYPIGSYTAIVNQVHVTTDLADFEVQKYRLQPVDDEVITLIFNPGYEIVTRANDRDYKGYLKIGSSYREVLRQLLGQGASKEIRHGLDGLLGNRYERIVQELVRNGEAAFESLRELAGYVKLQTVYNSFASCAEYLYGKLSSAGLLFESIEELIQNIIPTTELQQLLNSIKATAQQKKRPPVLSFAKKGQQTLDEMAAAFQHIATYLPSLDFLQELFWQSFNAILAKSLEAYEFLQQFAKAKLEYEGAMYAELGQSTYRKIFGKEGESLLKHAGQFIELNIGGGLFGTIPFLVGTIYQIIYDIVKLVIDLLWYAYHGAKGVLSWLLSDPPSQQKEMLEANNSLLKLFTFDFDINTLGEGLYSLLGEIFSLIKAAVYSFIDHAGEYGKTTGEIIASGALTLTSGAFSLITSGYPDKPTLFNRFIYIIKQWFNIGCLLGPIIVDIVLLFCSGGLSGIFSAAAKLGKLDKVGDAFRFFTKTKKLIEASQGYLRLQKLIPPRLEQMVQRLLAQLWAVAGRLQDQLKVMFHFANDLLATSGQALAKADIDLIARKLDKWYDIAGVVNLFAALSYFFIGGSNAQVSKDGKVQAAN